MSLIVPAGLKVPTETGNVEEARRLRSGICCRSGKASFLPARPQDSPFALITISNDGTLKTNIRYQNQTRRRLSETQGYLTKEKLKRKIVIKIHKIS